jgi:putative oxidoreductase
MLGIIYTSTMPLTIIRIASGFLMLTLHGWGKFERFSALSQVFPDPLGIGSPASLVLVVFAEVVCATLLVLGIATRLATIPLMITMMVAAFIIHADDPISKIELPIMYLIMYLAVFIGGPGKYALNISFFQRFPVFRWLINGS